MKILLIEDDAETADYIASGLRAEGHGVQLSRDGRDGFLRALDEDFDVMIVDRMIPHLDGLALVKSVRSAGCSAPVLFLSARAAVADRVEGLVSGGDDYLTKPFAFSELSARVNALGRRPALTGEGTETRLQVADLQVDLLRQTVTRAGQAIDLQPREYRLLCFLMRHSDRVVTRTMLLEAVWDLNFDPKTNVVDTQISRLREKIDKPFETALIHTVRGVGYSLHA
jgi:two-component system OmpR family response regulator